MKKYIRMLPLMLYPYTYLIGLVLMGILGKKIDSQILGVVIIGVLAVYQIVALVNAIHGAVVLKGTSCTAQEAAKVNLAVKAVQIPAYIYHFLLGLVCLFLSIWGIGLLMLVVAVNVISIALTGIHAVGCVVKLKKEGILSGTLAFVAGICSFIFCADLVAAWLMVRKSRISN